jgi:glyoxylase-like metal-dependent hydrolase (beta-lactamase superfamily II)
MALASAFSTGVMRMKSSRAALSAAVACLMLLSCWSVSAAETGSLLPRHTPAYPPDLLDKLRSAATRVPGEAPREIRYVKVAESHRRRADVLEGGSEQPYVLARTSFQVLYPEGWIMIDAGMDRQVHRFFGRDREEPYWQERNDALQRALAGAGLIVITHEHGDHVAGVIRTSRREEIAPHTILTKDQVRTLTLAPQMPEIRLDPDLASEYLVIDYALYYPVAPGVVLLKSPGHTPGHQMVYVRTEAGREYVFSGDVSWSMDGITGLTQKPPAQSERIKEDRKAIGHQLRWLKSVMNEEGVIVVPSHDETRLASLESRGLLERGLTIE